MGSINCVFSFFYSIESNANKLNRKIYKIKQSCFRLSRLLAVHDLCWHTNDVKALKSVKWWRLIECACWARYTFFASIFIHRNRFLAFCGKVYRNAIALIFNLCSATWTRAIRKLYRLSKIALHTNWTCRLQMERNGKSRRWDRENERKTELIETDDAMKVRCVLVSICVHFFQLQLCVLNSWAQTTNAMKSTKFTRPTLKSCMPFNSVLRNQCSFTLIQVSNGRRKK